MKFFVKIVYGIAVVILLLFGYNEYQKYKILSVLGNLNNSVPTATGAKEKGISPSDFKILSFNPKWENGRLRAVGEIKNTGKISGGPHVEVIARDEKGVLVESQDFWPNSISNISPGGTCGIEYTITRDRRAKTAEIKVVGVNVWN